MAARYMLHVNENCENLEYWWEQAVGHLKSCPPDAQCIFEEGVSKCSVDEKTLEAFEKWAARFDGWEGHVHQDKSEPCNPVRATEFWYDARVYSMLVTFVLHDEDGTGGKPDAEYLDELAHELSSEVSDDVGILDSFTNITALALEDPPGRWVVSVAHTLTGEGTLEPKLVAEVMADALGAMEQRFLDRTPFRLTELTEGVTIGDPLRVLADDFED
jgi:hypothetical protein